MSREEMRQLLMRGWEQHKRSANDYGRPGVLEYYLSAEAFLNMAVGIVDHLDIGEMTSEECRRHAATKPKPPAPRPKGIDPVPGDLQFPIWVGGYLATGMEGIPQKARLAGTGWGETFNDAVRQYVSWLPLDEQVYWTLSRGTWRMWGCVVTDEEAFARAAFG
jgi:hypothetical protein